MQNSTIKEAAVDHNHHKFSTMILTRIFLFSLLVIGIVSFYFRFENKCTALIRHENILCGSYYRWKCVIYFEERKKITPFSILGKGNERSYFGDVATFSRRRNISMPSYDYWCCWCVVTSCKRYLSRVLVTYLTLSFLQLFHDSLHYLIMEMEVVMDLEVMEISAW